MSSYETVRLTIRSTVKKIDELQLRCPTAWTIQQVKVFVAMNHRQGQDYFKPEKTQFYFGGKILENDEKLKDILKGKNLKQNFTMIAKFSAALEVEKPAINEAEEEQKLNTLLEYFKLFINTDASHKKNSSIDELDVYRHVPIMQETLSKNFAKLENIEKEAPAAAQNRNAEDEAQEQWEVEFQYIIKLIIRITVAYFLLKNHLSGYYLYFFIFVLACYFIIKLSQKRVRQRQQLRQQQQQLRAAALQIAAAAAAAAQQNAGAAGAQAGAQQNNANAGNANANANVNQIQVQVQLANQPEIPEEVPVQPTVFNKVKELFICFFSSLFPSWDVNLYIENNPVAQPNDPAPNPEQPEEPVAAIDQAENEVNPGNNNENQNQEEAAPRTEEVNRSPIKEIQPVINEENQRLLGDEVVIKEEQDNKEENELRTE